MRNLNRLLTLAALATTFALPAFAQTTPAAAPAAAAANPCEEAARGEMYTTYFNLKKKMNAQGQPDAAAQKEAYGIGKEYLAKYPTCADSYAKAVQKFIGQYDEAVTKVEFPKYLYGTDAAGTGKDLTKAFALGKEMIAANPNDLGLLINLGYAGYTAQSSKPSVTTYSAESLGYAKKAIQMIEGGQSPATWTPFKTKDESAAYLNFAVGEYMIKSDPAGAVPYYLKSLSMETPVKTTAGAYARLAAAYQVGQYDPLQKEFTAKFGGKPETDESKFALNNLYQVIDRVTDAYARAINLAGTDPKLADDKKVWLETLTGFYKFRNNESTSGLDAFIASATSKPLPAPFTPQPYVPAAAPAPSTGGTASDTGNTGSGNGNGATAAAPAAQSTTAAKPKTATKKP
jgi:tetratricopeptide (TPR) repeat protein